MNKLLMRTAATLLIVSGMAFLGAACGGGGGGGGTASSPGGGGNTVTGLTPPAQLPAATVDCGKGTETVSGRFVAPNGTTPVAGAYVHAESADCWAGTDGQGNFTFSGLPAGSTTVQGIKGFFKATTQAQAGVPAELKIDPAQVKIGYFKGAFDSIEAVAQRLGFAPVEIPASQLTGVLVDNFLSETEIPPEELVRDLKEHAALLLNCGMQQVDLTFETFHTGQTAADVLRAYVEAGGVVYASDFSEAYVKAMYPADIGFLSPDPRLGESGQVTATVVDEGLKSALGKEQAEINFESLGWAIIDSVPATTSVLVRGPVTRLDGVPVTGDRPFAVQFTRGKGRVLFTSFHNEAVTTADMNVLLEQMLFGL